MVTVALHGQDESERAKRHRHIDRDVDQHALRALRRACSQANQGETHVADRRIGHQSLDVPLSDGGERSQRHRGDRDEHHDLLPLQEDARKCGQCRASEHRKGSDLRRRGKERGDWRRCALIDVGRPHVERHCGNLEAKPREQEYQAEHEADTAGLRRRGDACETHGAGEAIDQGGAV